MSDAEPLRSPATRPELIARRVGDELVLVDVATGECWQLNASGAALWEKIAQGTCDEARLSAFLRERYPELNESAALEDVSTILTDLRRAGLLEP